MIRRLQTFRKTLSKSWLSSASSFDDSTSVLDESLLLADSQLDLSRKDDDDDDDDDRPTIAGLCEELYSSGAWRVLPLLLLTGIGLSIILPDLPSFCSNYFASKTGGRAIDCSGGEGTQAKECVDAHWQCVSFQSWILFLNNSVITFFFGPLLGKLSDTYGRRPFLVFGSFCGALPAFGFYLMSFGYTSYVAIYPFISLGTAFGNFGVSLAYVSDLVCLKYRTQALSIVLAELFLGVIFGPWLMALGDTRTRAMIAAAVAATNIFYSVCIPESLRKPLQSQSKRSLKSLFEDFCSLFKSRFFCLMAVIATIGSMVSEGQQDISAQYLQLVSGFTPKDQANLISVVGVAGLIVQLILVPLALKLVQRRWVGTGNDSLSLSAPASDSSLSLSLSLSLCVCVSFHLSQGALDYFGHQRHSRGGEHSHLLLLKGKAGRNLSHVPHISRDALLHGCGGLDLKGGDLRASGVCDWCDRRAESPSLRPGAPTVLHNLQGLHSDGVCLSLLSGGHLHFQRRADDGHGNSRPLP